VKQYQEQLFEAVFSAGPREATVGATVGSGIFCWSA
jgi:hypothetical protein